MRRQTQWPCFGHVSLVNELDYSEQLLCRLAADLTVLQLVDIVPSAAQTIEESFGWVFTPDFSLLIGSLRGRGGGVKVSP